MRTLRQRLDQSGRVVLITGGTMGIGLETGLAFGALGARTVLTWLWGTADEDDVRARFAAVGAPEPLLMRADAGSEEDTRALARRLASEVGGVDVLVANASTALMVRDLEDWSYRGLARSIEYSAWPLAGTLFALREATGRFPDRAVALSSTGPDRYSNAYDFVAASKAVLETMVRYLAHRLAPHGVQVNAIRSRGVRTAAFDATFGPDLAAFADRLVPPERWVPPEEVGRAVVALCSELMAGVSGAVLTVDRGTTFLDNSVDLYGRGVLPGAPGAIT